MKKQRKWKRFLLLVTLCAQLTAQVALADEIEWVDLTDTYDLPSTPVDETTFSATEAAIYDASGWNVPVDEAGLDSPWGTRPERLDEYTIVPPEECTHRDTSCKYTEVPTEYEEKPPVVTEPDEKPIDPPTEDEKPVVPPTEDEKPVVPSTEDENPVIAPDDNPVIDPDDNQGGETGGTGETGEQVITRLEKPVLSFNPDTLTFSWAEVPDAVSYSLHIVFWHEDCRPESYPVSNITGLSYTISDMSLLEGTYEVSADIIARSANGITSEASAEIKHRFYTPTPKPLAAPVLSFNADEPRMFSWTEVPGAVIYKLRIDFTLLDGSTFFSIFMWETPWMELYDTITQRYMTDVASLTAYVAAVDNIGTEGASSNVISYTNTVFTYGEEDEFGGSIRPITNQAYIDEVVRLVNVERAKAGLSPLSGGHAGLNAAAIARAQEIITLFSHTRPDGSKYTTALDRFGANGGMSGENIAMGRATPQGVVDQWMNSPGHRANILKPEYQYIGVGHAQIGGSQGGSYWVQMFLKNPDYKASTNTITSFALNGHSGIIDGNRIIVTVPNGTDVTSLAATSIVHTGERVTPANGEAQDFTKPVTYTVSTGDMKSAYTVRVVFSSTGSQSTSDDSAAQAPARPTSTGNTTAVIRATASRANTISANVARNTAAKASTGASKAEEKPGGNVEIQPDENQTYAQITGNNVNIRSTPTSRRTNPLGEVQQGNLVIVLGHVMNEEGAFLEITSADDITGFIPEDFAEAYGVDETEAGSYTLYIWSDGNGSFRTGKSEESAPDSIHGVLAGSIDFTDGQPTGRNGSIPDDMYGYFAAEYTK